MREKKHRLIVCRTAIVA